MPRNEYGCWVPSPVKCDGPACSVKLGPVAPRRLRSRHCDCRKLGLLKAECQMPASGVVEPEYLEAYATEPPEGRPRRAQHAYVLCIDIVRSTEDADW